MGDIGKGLGNIVGGFMSGAGLTGGYQPSPIELEKQKDLLRQMGQAETGFGEMQTGQQALAQALLAQTQGQGPAMDVMRQAQERANLQAAGMLASGRGVNPALAARTAAQQAAAGQQAVAGGAGQLALQSQQQLGGLYGQMTGQRLSREQMLQQAFAEQNRQQLQAQLGQQEMQAAASSAEQQARAGIIGGLLGGVGAGLTAGALSTPKAPVPAALGGRIDGKAKVKGDSYANDTVPALLSPGEIVVPRSAAQDEESAKLFIEHLMATEKKRKAKKG